MLLAATVSLALAPLALLAPRPAVAPTRAGQVSMLSREDGGKVMGVFLAALVAFAPLDEAQAARSGGRVGGRAPASRSMAPRTSSSRAPSYSAPSRTNVYITPAPVYGGGYGMGYGGMGGYGYSPFGGGMSTSTYLGISLVESLMREQQRQAYLQQQLRTQQELGRDQAMIQQLQIELQAQNAKVDGLKAQAPAAAPAAAQTPFPPSDAAIQMLQQQLLQQQQQIQALKAAAQ